MSSGQSPIRPTRPGTTPGSRLPSLRPVRDLTLGGGTTPVSQSPASSSTPTNTQQQQLAMSTRPKFAPNLSAAGRRQPSATSTQTEDSSSPAKRGRGGAGRGGRGRGGGGRGRGRGRHEPEIIQSKGIFSDGLAEGERAKVRDPEGGGGFSRRRDEESIDRSRTRVGPKSEALESDEQAMKQLMKDDFIAFGAYGSDRVKPVTLPLSDNRSQTGNTTGLNDVPVPMEMDIKPDVTTLVTQSEKKVVLDRTEISTRLGTDYVLPPAFQQLFGLPTEDKTNEGNLFFVQLPNILAHTLVAGEQSNEQSTSDPNGAVKREPIDVDQCQSSASQNGPVIKSEPRTEVEPEITMESPSSSTAESKPKDIRHTLAEIPQGSIGKLQLMKSGKVRLKLNETTEGEPLIFDVTPGAKTSFLQQVAAIKTGRGGMEGETSGGRGGEIFVLGDVEHRLLLTPKIDNLLLNLKKLSH